MMSARHVLAFTALLSTCVTLTCGYTLREPWSTDNQQLDEALKAIQERRRMIDDEPIGYGDLAFDEEDEDPWEREEPSRGYIDPATMEYLRDMIYGTEDTVEGNRVMGEVAPLVESPETSDADLEELNGIMEDDEEEKEEAKRIPTDMHKKEYDPSSIPAKKEMNGGTTDQLTQDEIEEIMEDEAEEALKESLGEAGEDGGQETVSDAELENVLGEDDQPDEGTDDLFPNIVSKEVNINKESFGDSMPSSYVTVKRKRSDYLPSIGDDEVAQAEEQMAVQGEGGPAEEEGDDSGGAREYIKQFLALEDDENTNLANALNLATLAQVKKSDRYIIEEADYIKKAIEDEQAIQMLKEELAEDEEKSEDRKRSDADAVQRVYEEQENDIEPRLENAIAEEEKEALQGYMAAKLRQYLLRTGAAQSLDNNIPEYTEDSLGRWFNGPVSADEEGINNQDMTLNPFIRDLMERYYSEGITKRAPAFIEEEYGPQIEYEEDEGEDDDIDDATRAEIATVLQAYVEDMSPTQRMLLKEAVREKLQELEDEEETENEIGGDDDYCPAFEVLDDCAAARQSGLYLDMEAIYMCNRHQMCYSCGSSQGYNPEECDQKYEADARLLCSKESNPEKCEQNSEFLLLEMRQSHDWVPFSKALPSCSETCADAYINGYEKKKKFWIGPE